MAAHRTLKSLQIFLQSSFNLSFDLEFGRHSSPLRPTSNQLPHRRRRVGHAVGKTPFVVVPGKHAHEGAVDHFGLVEVEYRGMAVVVEVATDVRLVGEAENALQSAV